MSPRVNLHPLIDSGLPTGRESFAGGTLVCNCTDRPVRVRVNGQIAHNHACGCTKCWKPAGANFSIVAVTPVGNVEVVENGEKLAVVDPTALIQRHACTVCGVHIYGPVEREHAFQGLAFIHPERFQETGWPAPGFAAFVSSAIEGGVHPSQMGEVRATLRQVGLEPYDCLSPPLMDAISTFVARKTGVLKD